MKKEDIRLEDIERILFGTAPPEFLLEVFARALIVFILMFICIRWLGNRLSGQLSVIEMTVMIMIGAMIALPMQVPENGLIQGLIVLLSILLIYNGVNMLGVKSTRAERLIQGKAVMLIKDGLLQVGAMRNSRVSRNQLFAALRNENISHLGELKRVYLEACGIFSIYKNAEPYPGLSVSPDKIKPLHELTIYSHISCGNCGYTIERTQDTHTCHLCGKNSWEKAHT